MRRLATIGGQCLAILGLAASAAPLSAANRRPRAPEILLPPIEPDTAVIAPVDPMTVIDDDFARHRDPSIWQGLTVQRIGFHEAMTGWRLWRIVNRAHDPGPLWIVPHDNENATFSAAIDAVRSWGGAVIAIDTVARDAGYAGRFNDDGGMAVPIDPNRHFIDAAPDYSREILRDRSPSQRIVIALHTNAPGFDPALPTCPGRQPTLTGSGEISIGMCSDQMQPRPSRARAWPFDDDDTLALSPYLVGSDPQKSYCRAGLEVADFNLVAERVADSDGSLSNYAALHALPYLNLETRDRGNDPAGIGGARGRLVAMIDQVMERCAPIAGLGLRWARDTRPAKPKRLKRGG